MGNITRIAIIGSTGQLGADVYAAFTSDENYHVLPITHDQMDITDYESVKTLLQHVTPDVVINCAAYVRVDDCEDHPWLAFKVNALGPLNVSSVCSLIGAICIHISTDFVFDGHKGEPYNELDTPNPINTYGLSKLVGEQIINSYAPTSLIIRTSSLFGANISRGKGSNFIETILEKSKSGQTIRVISDIYMSPTYTADISQEIYNIIQLGCPRGIYHLSNSGSCSWFELAEEVLTQTNPNAKLKPVPASEYPSKAIRPPISSLTSINLSKNGLKPMRNWKLAVTEYLTRQGHIKNP